MFRKLFLLTAIAAILTTVSFAGTISTYGGSNAGFGFGYGFERCLLWWTLAPGTDRLVTKVWAQTNNVNPNLVMFVTFWGTRDVSQGAGSSVTANELGTVRVPLSGLATGGTVWIETGDITSAGIVLPDFFGVEVEFDAAGTLVRGTPANYVNGMIKVSSGMTGGTVNDDYYTDANYNGMLENDANWDLWSRSSYGLAPCIEIVTAPAPSTVDFVCTVTLVDWAGGDAATTADVTVDSVLYPDVALTGTGSVRTCTIPALAAGSHVVKVKPLKALSESKTGSTPQAFSTQCGDTNDDNKIDDLDFLSVIGNFGSTDPVLKLIGDGNGDDKTDDLDFLNVIGKFATSGT